MDHETFPNAPIVEAVLDINVKLPGEITLESLEAQHEHMKDRFPEVSERIQVSGGSKLGPSPSALKSEKTILGYLFRSPQEAKLVQHRLDGFSFNKLKPYMDWDSFKSEAQELWQSYRSYNNPAKITRIALRYINSIEIPLPIKELTEYLLTSPVTVPNMAQKITRFLTRIESENERIPAYAVITQTIGDPTEMKKLPLILDIDVFHGSDYTTNMDAIWDVFEELRDYKNEIFFNSISEKTKELFR